jgi:hypothetical protein
MGHYGLVTLTTDFGTAGGYVAQMKAAILGIGRELQIVDVSHDIPPQDVASAAWLIRDVVDVFPLDTVHVVVVDPGVGTSRRILAGRWSVGTFVFPDNGCLTLIDQDFPRESLVFVDRNEFWRTSVSSTFHGRDILSPVAAHLARGVRIHDVGSPAPEILHLGLPRPRQIVDGIEATIVRIDSFGNLITNLCAEQLSEMLGPGEGLTWRCRGHAVLGTSTNYDPTRTGEAVVLVGSSGRYELAVIQGSAARAFGAHLGDSVVVHRSSST